MIDRVIGMDVQEAAAAADQAPRRHTYAATWSEDTHTRMSHDINQNQLRLSFVKSYCNLSPGCRSFGGCRRVSEVCRTVSDLCRSVGVSECRTGAQIAVCGRGSARGQVLYPDAVAGAQP